MLLGLGVLVVGVLIPTHTPPPAIIPSNLRITHMPIKMPSMLTYITRGLYILIHTYDIRFYYHGKNSNKLSSIVIAVLVRCSFTTITMGGDRRLKPLAPELGRQPCRQS